jgi:hypothetical protein
MTARSVLRFSMESEEAQSERRKRHFSSEYVLRGRSWDHEVLPFTSVKPVDLQGCPGRRGKKAARSGNIAIR